MKYPYGTIGCIIGAVLNAFWAGMDIASGRRAILILRAILAIFCAGVAISSSLQCWSLKEKLFKAYMKDNGAA